MQTRHMRTTAPSFPKTSTRIWMTGWPYSEDTVRSKSWMENKRQSSRKKPKMADTPIDVNTPIGADQEALRVSSERWADASKPVIVYWLNRTPQIATYAGEALTDHPGSPVP
jgi:hypothetical protein